MVVRLEAMEAQNRALNEQLLSVQEDERIELARDLHDEVAPFLFTVGADAAMIRQFVVVREIDAIQTRADSIADAVRHMQRHVKNILGRLAPGALLNQGLPSAIDNLVTFWKVRCPAVTFNLEVAEDAIEPPLDVVIFRVVQESFSNAIRHGNPLSLSVRIHTSASSILVTIEDDGNGFTVGTTPNGFGIRGMRERVKAARGELQIRSRPSGQGVLVEAEFRLSRRNIKIEAERSGAFA
jgi:two-component system sensor histidine kinase UhpB